MEADYRLGDWIVRPQRDCIERGDEVVHLKPKAVAVLQCLAAGAGTVVTRGELFDAVWPNCEVSDAVLSQCVVELRRAFGDSAHEPRYIETIPKIGFRLIPAASLLHSDAGSEQRLQQAPAEACTRWPRPVHRVLLVALMLLTVFALVRHGVTPETATAPGDSAPYRTLAVLPFTDISADHSQGWFADGLTDELINRLAQLDGLRVSGRTSSFYFRSGSVGLDEVARTLGVEHILEGSVRREGQRLRVTAHLVETSTGLQAWADVYDLPLEGIFAVQVEIAESVAAALSIRLGVGELGSLPGGTSSVDAYDRYLQAWELFREFTPESILRSIELIKQATTIDPAFATAWTSLATFYLLAPIAFTDDDPADWLARSEEALAQARKLNPSLVRLLEVSVDLHGARNEWAGAETVISQSGLTLDRMSPELLFSYGLVLAKTGRLGEALALLRRAHAADPLAPWISSKLGYIELLNGRIDEALAELERTWSLESGNRLFQSWDGLCAALASRDRDTVQLWLSRFLEYANDEQIKLFAAMERSVDDPGAALARLRSAYEQKESMDPFIAVWAAYHGDPHLALAAMSRSPDAYSLWLPVMEDMRQQPGFKNIVRSLGLDDYWRRFGWADLCRPVGQADFDCR